MESDIVKPAGARISRHGYSRSARCAPRLRPDDHPGIVALATKGCEQMPCGHTLRPSRHTALTRPATAVVTLTRQGAMIQGGRPCAGAPGRPIGLLRAA